MNPSRFSGLLFSTLLLALPACGVSVIGGGSGGEGTTTHGDTGTGTGTTTTGDTGTGTGTTTTTTFADGGTGGQNGCGGVCNGMTQSSAPISSVGALAGTWALCGGQLYLQSPNANGFPDDTTGFEILADGTTYLHVAGDAGSFPRGVGPQYEWKAALNFPDMSTDPSITTLNLSCSYLNALLAYDTTFMPAANGCGAALHLEGASSGLPPEGADLIAY